MGRLGSTRLLCACALALLLMGTHAANAGTGQSTTTTITASANPSYAGASVTYSIVVTGSPGTPPNGSVAVAITDSTNATVWSGSTGLLNDASDPTQSTSTAQVLSGYGAFFSAGTYTVTATYGGDGYSGGSVGTLTQTVQLIPTTTSVSTSPDPSLPNNPVTFTVHVTPQFSGSSAPTGDVTLTVTDATNAQTWTGSSSVVPDGTGNGSTAQVLITGTDAIAAFPQAGSYTVSAHYSGSQFAAPSDAAATQTVVLSPTATSVTTSPDPSATNAFVTANIQVRAAMAGVTPGAAGVAITVTDANGTQTWSGTTMAAPSSTTGISTASMSIEGTAFPTAGRYVISASYAGNALTALGSSGTALQVVNVSTTTPTTTTLRSSADPSLAGASVTFTATVARVDPRQPTPTGSVSFFDGTTLLGSGTLDASGQASFTTIALAAGLHPLTAIYGGDATYALSFGTLAQAVNTSTTIISASVDPSLAGGGVTYSFSVPGNGSANTGAMALTITDASGAVVDTESVPLFPLDPTHNTGSVTLSGLGPFANPGVYLVTATWTLDPTVTASLYQVVNLAQTATTVSASSNPSLANASVTFTVNVQLLTAGGAPPSGGAHVVVTAPDGTQTLSTDAAMVTDASGTSATGQVFASGPFVFPAAGQYLVTVHYSGNQWVAPSDTAMVQTAVLSPTTTSVTTSPDPAAVGASVTATVSVRAQLAGATPGAANAHVVVTDANSAQTWSGDLPVVPLSNGTAGVSFTIPATAFASAGTYVVSAAYAGSPLSALPSSGSTRQVANASTATPTTLALHASADPSLVGASVTFTAAVARVDPRQPTPTGTVSFFDGTTLLGTATLSSAQATYTTSALAAGVHPIVAIYNGDATYALSLATVSEAVNTPTTMISASADPSLNGAGVMYTVSVNDPSHQSGTVNLTVTDATGAVVDTESANVIIVSGTTLSGTATVSGLGAYANTGVYLVTATYAADPTESASLYQVVNGGETSLAISSAPNPSLVYQDVVFTAHVTGLTTGQAPAQGNVHIVVTDGTGTQVWSGDGFAIQDSGNTANATAQVTASGLSFPTAGQYLVTAHYGGNAWDEASDASMVQTTQLATTTTTVSASADPAAAGAAVTFTVQVTASPAGAATPMYSAHVAVTNASGTQTWSGDTVLNGVGNQSTGAVTTDASAFPAPGHYTVTASFPGSAFDAASSGTMTETIGAASTTAVTSSSNPSTYGGSVTFTATVSGTAGTPTGSVQFSIDGTPSGAPVALTNGAATLATSALGAGTHQIAAAYAGGTTYLASNGTLAQTVNKADQTIAFAMPAVKQDADASFAISATASSGLAVSFASTTTAVCTVAGTTVTIAGAGTCTITASQSGDANWNAAPPITRSTLVNAPPAVTGAPRQSADESTTTAINLGSFADAAGSPWAIDVDWGDGSAHDRFSASAAGALGARTHTYADGPASRTVTVTVTDTYAAIGSASFTVDVSNIAPAVSSFTASAATINENDLETVSGAFTDPGTLDTHTAVIDWGDGSATTTLSLAAGTLSFSATHRYLDDAPSGTASDPYTIAVTVTDNDGGSGTGSTTIAVRNVAPTVGAITAPTAPLGMNTSFAASAPFSDPGTLDTFTAAMAWGDGTTTTQSVAAGATLASFTHAYVAAGVYTLALTVTDDDTGSGTSTFQYVVAYDPSAGFVTGAGWITSPAGAYAADPTLTGRANFGFVSRYQKGATVPTGNTQFQFQVANLDFHSTSYDWLVISGSRAQYKGSGTIDGSGDYGFLLTAVDGQVSGGGGSDRFRIKIWDKATGAVVYDNQIGASDDASPNTIIGGGSITIHS